jgi:ABC-2 type transport system permease protein
MNQLVADARTMIWKEWTEFVRQRATIISMLFFIAIFGIFLPFERGARWVTGSGAFINAIVLPVMLVLGVVADSFAGERERHTLESLLSTRLTDRAILAGKYLAIVVYAWGLTLAGGLVALLTVNLTAGHGDLLMYTPRIGFGSLVFSLLGSGLAAGAGVLISLRASTVRQAAQTLSIGMTVTLFVLIAGLAAMPKEIKGAIGDRFDAFGPTGGLVAIAVILLALDLLLLAIAAARFQRTKLILD